MGIILGERTSTVKVRLCGRLQNNSNGKMEAELLAELDHDTGVGIILVSHVHHMGITCTPHGYHMNATWVSYQGREPPLLK